VCFICTNCYHFVHRTYEIKPKPKGKQRRFGKYEESFEIRRERVLSRSFDYFEGIFERMWSKHDVVDKNCFHWTRDFYNKV
jgi:hypothetical protein